MKRPRLKKVKHLIPRRKRQKEAPVEDVPRITTETIAAHREEVLGSARKYIYPLQHSKHRILLISTTVLIASVVGFFAYCTLALYKFKNSSTFLYRVTQVLPFPVARAGSHFVDYENYLFELRHYTHYYQSQLELDFNSPEGKQQLDAFRKQALDKVINDAYIKQLADKYNVSVSEQELNDQITIVRTQNRLGSSDQVFEDVLKDYWGWTVNDFKRSLRQQILTQKVVSTLDTDTKERADKAYKELEAGRKFGDVAKKYSDDTGTKSRGGDFGAVDRTNRDLTAQTVEALFALRPGHYSGIINIGYSLEIVKNIANEPDGKIHGGHILFNFKDISVYLNDLKEQQKARAYIDG
jgi:parvulin-like peptidyl-prolyl isomerase